jgi:transcriptional regulator with XRE-family HTH domain
VKYHTFPEVLRLIRKTNRWSVRVAAGKMKISPSSLQRYENGEVQPTLPVLYRIAEAVDIDMGILTGTRRFPIPASEENHIPYRQG